MTSGNPTVTITGFLGATNYQYKFRHKYNVLQTDKDMQQALQKRLKSTKKKNADTMSSAVLGNRQVKCWSVENDLKNGNVVPHEIST